MERRHSSPRTRSPSAKCSGNTSVAYPEHRISILVDSRGGILSAQLPLQWNVTEKDAGRLTELLNEFAGRPKPVNTSSSSHNVNPATYVQKSEDISIPWGDGNGHSNASSKASKTLSKASMDPDDVSSCKIEELVETGNLGQDCELSSSAEAASDAREYSRDFLNTLNFNFTDMDKVWRVIFSRLGGLPQNPCAAVLRSLLDQILCERGQRRDYPFHSPHKSQGSRHPPWWPIHMLEWVSPARMPVQSKKAAIAYIFMLPKWDPAAVAERLPKIQERSWSKVLERAVEGTNLRTGYHRKGNDGAGTDPTNDDNTSPEELRDRLKLMKTLIDVAALTEQVVSGGTDVKTSVTLHDVPKSLKRVMYGFGPGHSRRPKDPASTMSKRIFFGGPSNWPSSQLFDSNSHGNGGQSNIPKTRKATEAPQAATVEPKRARLRMQRQTQRAGDEGSSQRQHARSNHFESSFSQAMDGSSVVCMDDDNASSTAGGSDTEEDDDDDMRAPAVCPHAVNNDFSSFTSAEAVPCSNLSGMYPAQSGVTSAATSFSSAGLDPVDMTRTSSSQMASMLPSPMEMNGYPPQVSPTESFDSRVEHCDRWGGSVMPEAAPQTSPFAGLSTANGNDWSGFGIANEQPMTAGFVDGGDNREAFMPSHASQEPNIAYEVAMGQQCLYSHEEQQFYVIPKELPQGRAFEAGGSGINNGFWDQIGHIYQEPPLGGCLCGNCEAYKANHGQA